VKISILLPTRDRLPLLRLAIESVRRLDDRDWEIVVSDNQSSGDVAGYIRSLDDARIRYLRTPQLLSITDNWNNALAHSTGDYVIMMGDDDALLSNYFATTRRLIATFDQPHLIYHNALCYAYPGVIPSEPDGFLRSEGYADFLEKASQPFRLPPERARALVKSSMDFRISYSFNMQFVTIKRSLIDELAGSNGFYRSPFPDYYAMNHLFARAREIVVEPRPLVVIGVSKSSFGFFHNNQLEQAGKSFLAGKAGSDESEQHRAALLPGTNINDGWLRAMEDLQSELGLPVDLKPNYSRYRMLQIIYTYTGHHLRGTVGVDDLANLRRHLQAPERLFYDLLFAILAVTQRVSPASIRCYVPTVATLISRQFPWWNPVRDTGNYGDITDVVERIDGDREPERWRAQRGPQPLDRLLRAIFP
jgi:glycosyltransferase involved in cell wall biosynthesis